MTYDFAEKTALDRKPDLEPLRFHDDRGARVGDRRRPLRLGRKQHSRIGMLRILEDFACRTGFDDLAALHDADAIRHLAHDTEIMGDEQHGHAVFGLQLLE